MILLEFDGFGLKIVYFILGTWQNTTKLRTRRTADWERKKHTLWVQGEKKVQFEGILLSLDRCSPSFWLFPKCNQWHCFIVHARLHNFQLHNDSLEHFSWCFLPVGVSFSSAWRYFISRYSFGIHNNTIIFLLLHACRSYYRCTQDNCRVKKRVERLAEDPRMVITTYEGRHIHSPSHDLEESQAPSHLNNFFW